VVYLKNKKIVMNKSTIIGGREFRWGERTYVMGILNMSPESFSGDGLAGVSEAQQQAASFAEEGADILDIGGQSTKPGLPEISEADEISRVIPVIKQVCRVSKAPVSVDTSRYEVARQALEAGAEIINDQWGLKREPRLAELAVKYKVPIILMSNQRDIGGFDANSGRDTSNYDDVMRTVKDNLRNSIAAAEQAGVPGENIIIDPGIGFGHTWQQDLEIVRRLSELKSFGQPLLIGTSRKSLIKMVLKTPANDRLEGTAATVAIAIANGADIVRVHDVKQMVRVCRMADAVVRMPK
jgi:dihydropteroate synthase